MVHVPHVFVPRPWPPAAVPIPPAAAHHLSRVLRVASGAPVSYTDGQGHVGEGRLLDEELARGAERFVAAPQVAITIAVAPPHDKDRLRFMVEKLAELEVRRIVFLRTRFGVGRLPDNSKALSWAIGALEQSQGAWLMEVEAGWTDPGTLDPTSVWVADPGADQQAAAAPAAVTIAIGPEGGWAPGELPAGAFRFGLGRTVLRVETAAIVAAGLIRSSRKWSV